MANGALKELKPSDFDEWKAQHLLNRAGFGAPPAIVQKVAEVGVVSAVDLLVDYERNAAPLPVANDEFDSDIMRPPTAEERMMFQQARRNDDADIRERLQQERQQREMQDRQQMGSMQRWWMKRMIETPRPLEEKLTLFWHGHFAASYRGVQDSYHMFLQNQFFRANASGSFAELVNGIIRDPAMLKFLNNDQSRRERPNENLARELMELFTLGEGNVYTESDIKEGARALTGYNVDDDDFVFRDRQHDNGTKQLFGQTGRFDGADFCKLILAQRVVSEFVCSKLYRFFVNDAPGELDKPAQTFVLALAKLMRDSSYAIKPVLRAMFLSEHFYQSQNVAAVIKSPVQLIVQSIRSLRTPVRNLQALTSAADLMGQNLFFPPSVKGWDGGRSWINTSTLFVRQNLLVFLLTGRRPEAYEWQAEGSPYDAMTLVEHLPRASDDAAYAEQVIRYLLRFNLGSPPHQSRVQALMDYVNAHGKKIDNDVMVKLLCLIAAMPEYQLC